MIKKIISGGQTGVDRAVLDIAGELGIARGGWCPKGRLAQDGPLAPSYPLLETPSGEYTQRTEWNVRDSHGTLVLHTGTLCSGTALTVEFAHRLSKPHLVVDLNSIQSTRIVHDWIKQYAICVLNVAGPREEGNLGVYVQASRFLIALLVR